MEKEKRKSKTRKLAEEGCFGAFYTLDKWFVKFKPAYLIDAVEVSFVQKGKKGEGFDVYISIQAFSFLCNQILSFRMEKLIEIERTKHLQNPECFEYVTGDNGQKKVAIGAGMNGNVVIQGKNGNVWANVPCSYQDLWIMADMFCRTSEKWFADMAKTIVDAYVDGWNDHVNAKAEEEKKSGQKKNIEKAAQHTAPPVSAEQVMQQPQAAMPEAILSFYTVSGVKNYQNCRFFEVKLDNNTAGKLIFSGAVLEEPWFAEMVGEASTRSVNIKCKVLCLPNFQYQFIGVVKGGAA